VGGGATGVEYIGELTDFLRDVTLKERKGAYALIVIIYINHISPWWE